MKIVIISNLYPPYVRGGAELVARTMAEDLKEHLQHVVVITSKPYVSFKSLAAESITINDVPTYRFYPLNIFYYLNDYKHSSIVRAVWHIIDIFNLHSYWQIRRILKHEKPDVVITHNLIGLGFLIPRLISKLRISHVHLVHDVQLVNPSGIIIKGEEDSPSQRFYSKIGYIRLMRWLFSKTIRVISPSNFLLDFYSKHSFFMGAKKFVLPNPVSISNKKLTHIKSSKLRLLYLGQITSAKGIEGLTTVVRSLINDKVELKIVGLGPQLKSLMKNVKGAKNIKFYGWKNHAVLSTIFSNTDALVLPTLCYDNSPTVIFEALGNGIPVIASDIGGVGEIIESGKNGWLFPAGDWGELKLLIAKLEDDRELVSKIASNTRNSVKDFSRIQYIQRLLTILDN